MKIKILSLFLAVAMLTALSACSGGGKNVNVSGSDSSSSANVAEGTDDTESTQPPSDDQWNPVVTQRQLLADEGSMCGVLYLGYGSFETYNYNFKDNREYFTEIIRNSGYVDSFDFLLSVPDEYWVDTGNGGSEFYLIIPADEKAKVEIYSLGFKDGSTDIERGEILYSQDTGAPFLLKCNYSDLFPECEIVITDSKGEVLNWRPGLSLRDGTVINTTEDGKTVHDFTAYPEGTKEE